MKKSWAFVLILIILLTSMFFVNSQGNQTKTTKQVYEGLEKESEVRVIVKLKEPVKEKGFFIKTEKTDSEIKLERQEIKKEIIEKIEEENIKHVFEESIAVEVSESELDELEKNPNVKSIVIDKPIKAFLQDSVPLINATNVWDVQVLGINVTGIDETVCVIDTGIDFTHPDLAGKNKTCVIDCVDKSCVENCSINDDNGHGTHVAGIVVANGGIKGVAIESNLIGVKVLGTNGSGYDSDVKAGIDWCVNNSEEYNISVISMSLGSEIVYNDYCENIDDDSNLTGSINSAVLKNISVVVATGNAGSYTHISSPACIKNAIAVGATDKNDLIAIWSGGQGSNRNSITDLLAPGTNINSTYLNSNYEDMSGTSMSTPHVAGAFALIRQFYSLRYNKILTPSEIEQTLKDTGKQIPDSASGLNFSRIDVYSAILALNASCVNNILNTTSSWVNETGCRINNTILQNRTILQYDSNNCWNFSNSTIIEYQEIGCDFCMSNWTEVLNETCQDGDFKVGWFNDTNGCYIETSKPENITYNYSCDYDDNGIISSIDLINDSSISNLSLTINGESNLSQNFDEVQKVIFKDNDKTILEFDYNFSFEDLNLANLTIQKQTNESYGFVVVKGLDLVSQNQTKTIYLERVLNGTGICIKDAEVNNISEVSETCDGTDEFWLSCPGVNGNYNCSLTNDSQYKITGLNHSGIREQETYCGDEECNDEESCSSCFSDCGCLSGYSCSSRTCVADAVPPSSSGGGGGGSRRTTPNITIVNETINQTIGTTSTQTNEEDVIEQDSEIQKPTSSGITGAVTGFAKSGRGIVSIILVLGLAGAFIVTRTIKKKKRPVVI